MTSILQDVHGNAVCILHTCINVYVCVLVLTLCFDMKCQILTLFDMVKFYIPGDCVFAH